MARVAGIDPGTKSMDVCAIEDGRVYRERSIDNAEIMEDPETIKDALREAEPLDLISGPSGYGVELTRIDEVPNEIFEDWYYNYILLTTKEEIEGAVDENVFGAILYKNMTDFSFWMKREGLPVIFIPSVTNLPTVPPHRKINRMDMGTADKMAVTVLGVHDQSKRLEVPYSEVSFVLVEMGFGYNAVIGVENGRIVDGIGGTNFPNMGFLTASALDFELVQIVGQWEKRDVFTGGASSISEEMDPEEFVKGETRESEIAFDAMMEGVEKAVSSMKVSVGSPREILLSGRLTKVEEIKTELMKRLSTHGEIRELGFLEGAEITKETAQGYAMIAEGLAGGEFEELIDWMKIGEAKGTCYDYVHHPKFKGIESKLVEFKPRQNVE